MLYLHKTVFCITALLASVILNCGFAVEDSVDQLMDYEKAVGLALWNSYEILISQEEIQASATMVEGAQRAFYPKVRLQGSTRGDILEMDDFYSTYGLVLDWNPYQSGEVMRRYAESKTNFYISKLSREQTVIDLVIGVQELYYEILKAQYALEVEKFSLETQKAELESAEAEYSAGRIKSGEILDARSAFFEKELALERERQAFELKLIRLKHKLQNDGFSKVAEVERNIIKDLNISVDDCIRTSYLRSRSYITVRERENLARLGVKYSKLKRLPSVNFFTSSDYALDASAPKDQFGFRVGVSASYPLYDAGETRAIIENAESLYRRARLEVRKERETVTLQVTERYHALKNQLEILKVTSDKEKRFEDDWLRAELDFENGAISKSDYEKFKYAYMKSRNRIISLELDVMLAQSALLRAIGIRNFEELIR